MTPLDLDQEVSLTVTRRELSYIVTVLNQRAEYWAVRPAEKAADAHWHAKHASTYKALAQKVARQGSPKPKEVMS